MQKTLLITLAIGALLMGQQTFAQEDSVVVDDFFEMSLEDLMNVEVTSVSKKAERLQDVASSIYVVTHDELLKSPHTRLVDILRNVPGFWGSSYSYLDVSTGVREPADGLSGTVLVLLDGVPLQSPFSSSFDYANFDIPLDQIDRIEIIKGPGGTIYGANAATGVISIFTRKSEEIRASVEYGMNNLVNTSITGGKNIGDKLNISGYGQYKRLDEWALLDELTGDSITTIASDTTGDTVTVANRLNQNVETIEIMSAGARLTYDISETKKLAVGINYNSVKTVSETATLFYPFADVALSNREIKNSRLTGSARYDHEFNENHTLFAQTSFSTEDKDVFASGGYSHRTSFVDLEVQDNFSRGRHNVVLGANLRQVMFNVYEINDPESVGFINRKSNHQMWGTFVQDKIDLIEDKLSWTLGAKLENWTLIDHLAVSPSTRFTFTPNEHFTFWGAASRSNTTPGYITTDIEVRIFKNTTSQDITDYFLGLGINPFVVNTFIVPSVYSGFYTADGVFDDSQAGYYLAIVNGDETKRSFYNTFEGGFRTSVVKNVLFETNFFYAQKQGVLGALRSEDAHASNITEGDTILPLYYTNLYTGHNIGLETIIKAQLGTNIRVEASHSWLKSKLVDEDGVIANEDEAPRTPEHIFRLKTFVNFEPGITISAFTTYMTEFYAGIPYLFDEQTYEFEGREGKIINPEINEGRLILDFKIEKAFLDNKLGINIWGTDMLFDAYVESQIPSSSYKPKQVGRLVGLGANYKF